MPNPLSVVLGADHGGFTEKKALLEFLDSQGYAVHDCGAFSVDPEDDYPRFAVAVALEMQSKLQRGESTIGILLCRSGAGMCIAANRFANIRAVSVSQTEQAYHARAHNDANLLVLSGDWTPLEEMKKIILAFLDTPFSAEPRHVRRLAQIDQLGGVRGQ